MKPPPPVETDDGAARPRQVADPTVLWDATLIQPTVMQAGSHQPVVLSVTAPVVLDGPARIQVDPARSVGTPTGADADWQDQPGQHRRTIAFVAPAAGVYRVSVHHQGAQVTAEQLLLVR